MKQRVITALVLFCIVIPVLFYIPQYPYFRLFLALVVGIAAWEWSGFCFNVPGWRLGYSFFCISLYFLFSDPLTSLLLIILVSVIWLFLIFRILNHGSKKHTNIRILVLGILIICGFAIAIYELRELSISMLLVVLLTVWAADSLALVVGKNWGKNLLIPKVSPNKTWEGLYGGIVAGLAIAIGSSLYWEISMLKMLGITTLTTLMSVVGDLFISCYKRQCGLDDTGKLFPGHGGLLDRIDGLLAAVPIYFILLKINGLYWV